MIRASLAVAVMLAACGGGREPVAPVVVAPVVVDAAATPPAIDAKQRAVLDGQATKAGAHRAGPEGPQVDGYVQAAEAVTAIHASPAWRKAKPKANAYVPVEAARLAEVAEHAKLLGLAYEEAALALRADDTTTIRVADALDALSVQLSGTYHDWFYDLNSDLLQEIQFDAALCRKPARPKRGDQDIDPVCTYMGALTGVGTTTTELGTRARAAIDDAVDAVMQAFAGTLEPHATTALMRAVGDGPAYGEPCGFEQLCAWRQDCMPATSTCEHHCSTSAMQQCPGADVPLQCVAVPALGDTFCRPVAR